MSMPHDPNNPNQQFGPGQSVGGSGQPPQPPQNPPGHYSSPAGPQQGGPQFASPAQGQQPQAGYQGMPPRPGAQGPQGAQGQQQMYAAGYSQQGYGQPAPQKKPKTGLWIGLGAVAVVLVAALVLVFSGVFGNKTAESGAGGDSSAQLPADPKEAAKTVVQNYLTALSEGRADDAKALLGSSSALDGALLTADVLKDSLSRAPITNIQVNEPTGSDPTFRVPVSYTIGDSTATEDFKVDAASKKIETQLPKLRTSQGSKADLTVNGTAVKSDEVTVFPGSYQVASGNKYLELKGETQALVKNSLESNYVSVEFTPSQAGIDLFREKVLPEAKACLASANLDPGCNMALSESLSDGTTLTDGTIKRTQDSEASATMENVTPKVGSSVPTILSSNEFGNFKISATCTKGGRTGECNVLGFGSKGTRWPKASINVADADPKVTWENS